jgi:hypothetical protein
MTVATVATVAATVNGKGCRRRHTHQSISNALYLFHWRLELALDEGQRRLTHAPLCSIHDGLNSVQIGVSSETIPVALPIRHRDEPYRGRFVE